MKTLSELLADMGTMSFAEFMRTALYEPNLGYYARGDKLRVGTRPDADFYTSESLGPIFAELALGAAWNIAEPWQEQGIAFVEMGAEAPNSVADAASPPFASGTALRRGQDIPTGTPVLLFSNELFDAQPFHRLLRLDGRWRECGVRMKDGKAEEVLLNRLSAPVTALEERLPPDVPDGYRMDLPLEAEALMARIAAQKNVVAIVAFDYGLDWADILYRRPAGTARAYRHHELCTDLLAAPGEQDLTCHICWDGLENVLRDAGFEDARTMRQESFFMRHAMEHIENIMGRGDMIEASKLRELIHPSRMGAAFQVLVATRG